MAGQKDMGPEELRDRLLEFDQAVSLEHPGSKFVLVFAGGGALALLGVLDRPTSDLDVLNPPRELSSLMEEYDLNGRVAAHSDCFPYDYEDRCVPLDLPTEAVACYSVALEDLVAAKLCAGRPVDEADVRRAEVVDAVDWDRLADAVAELKKSVLNERRYHEALDRYLAYREECKR